MLIYSAFADFTNVITFDGAYSLFPAQYDGEESRATPAEPSPAQSRPMFRSFSDRSSWVVTFEQTSMARPQLAFGTSLPARDSLYTSSLLVSPPHEQPDQRPPNTQLCGVVLRSRLLRLAHVMCCAELSRLVQQFLTRQVLAHPGRSTS